MRLSISAVAVSVSLCAAVIGADPDVDTPTLGGAFVPADALREKQEELKIRKLPTSKGAVVMFALKNGPLDKAGIGTLDVITHIDGEPVTDTDSFTRKVRSLPTGKPVKIVAYHVRRGRNNIAWDRKSYDVTPLTRGETAMASMEAMEDTVLRLTTYKHVDDPGTPGATGVIVRFHKSGDSVTEPTIRFQLQRDSYFGIRTIIVHSGDRLVTIPIPGLTKSEISGGLVWEWHDISLDASNRDLRAILEDGENLTVRFVSAEYRHDHEIELAERERIRTAFTAYRALGGK